MASDEVCRVDKIGRLNGLIAETEVRNGDAAGLFGVVEEVTLNELIRMVAYNLNRVLVRADGTVRAETVELAGNGALRSRDNVFGEVERSVGDIVVNTDGEVVLRLVLFEVLVNRVNHGRVEFLGTQTVSAAYNRYAFFSFQKRGANVEV